MLLRFPDDVKARPRELSVVTRIIAEDEGIRNDMLMELNDRCEDYGIKININNTDTMIIERKPKKTRAN